MPANTKLLRSGEVAGLRRVYVSWLEPKQDARDWIAAFTLQVSLETAQDGAMFAETMQTGDIDAGDLLAEWLDPAKRNDPITDVVGILTTAYLFENTDRSKPAQGELAQFFDQRVTDTDDRLRVFLAPLETLRWTSRVRQVVLGDPEGVNADWLFRLREQRFPWPSEKNLAAVAMDEIVAAVSRIVEKLDLK
jgi:hypothetical protein